MPAISYLFIAAIQALRIRHAIPDFIDADFDFTPMSPHYLFQRGGQLSRRANNVNIASRRDLIRHFYRGADYRHIYTITSRHDD